MQILLGADPEVFIEKGGNPFSAFGLLPGTKKSPHKVKDGALQVDGMAGEFNIKPAKTAEQFVHSTQSVLDQLAKMLPADCKVLIKPSVRFDKAHFDAQPEEAKMLGCDPDFDAYNECANNPPNNKTTMRTAAGHVHIGWGKGFDTEGPAHLKMCYALVKQLDVFLGVPSLDLDLDGADRRQMYGRAGCFRPKPYGCEYRVLSNFWLKSPELMRWVFNQTHLAISELMAGRDLGMNYGYLSRDIIGGYYTNDWFSKQYPEVWKVIATHLPLVQK